MIMTNIKIAFASLRSSKLRTILTMTGIIIGVASVTLILALGEGVKQQVSDEANSLTADTIEVRPGNLSQSMGGNIGDFNLLNSNSPSTLNEKDVELIKETPGVAAVAPFMFVTGSVKYQDRQINSPFIVATSDELPKVFEQELKAGEFFYPGLQDNVAVVGKNVANELLGVDDQVGGRITIRGQEFTVIGVIDNQTSTGIFGGLAPNFNDIVMVPFGAGKEFYSGSSQVQQINIKPTDDAERQQVISDIRTKLLASHHGEEDFTVATKEEALELTNGIIEIITTFTAAIASISLFVGGIGIMNIMFVSVTERTREIGIRKSIGATNGQILSQFLIESTVISVVGGIIGVAIAYIVTGVVAIQFDLTPIITLSTVLFSFGISVGVGILFGIAPAIKAGRKDPIAALRHE